MLPQDLHALDLYPPSPTDDPVPIKLSPISREYDNNDHGSEDNEPPFPTRLSRNSSPLQLPTSDKVRLMCQNQSRRKVSFPNSDGDDDDEASDNDSDEESEDGGDIGGSAETIEHRRRKFHNEEIDEVEKMFHKFKETKVKPCAECLGCTVLHLMKIGKWALNTLECQPKGNSWNAYLSHLKST